MTDVNKKCSKCKTVKSPDSFHKNRVTTDGYARWCKECKRNHRSKVYHSPAGDKERKKNRERNRIIRYGVTPEIYESMFAEQNGKCFLCDKSEKVLHVDHCHITGSLRKLLCRSCNLALGFLFDNTETLTKAVDYVERYR